uniref:Uncharacterized protein n=1 Tax=Romanomermis culicivorax TaxID=13658 RepID=A0A915J8D0_ROMCU
MYKILVSLWQRSLSTASIGRWPMVIFLALKDSTTKAKAIKIEKISSVDLWALTLIRIVHSFGDECPGRLSTVVVLIVLPDFRNARSVLCGINGIFCT